MQKITVLTQYYKPEISAPSNRLSEMCEYFYGIGWQVQIITSMPNYPTGRIFNGYRRKLFVFEQIENIKVYRYPIYPSNSKRTLDRIFSLVSFSIVSLFSIYKVNKFKPDFILVETPPLTLVFTGFIIARIVNSKLIMNVSDLWPLTPIQLGYLKNEKVIKYLYKFEKFLFEASDLILGQSSQITDYIKNKTNTDVYLYRNGVKMGTAQIVPQEKNGKIRFVYAGLLGIAQDIFGICKNVDFKKLNCEFHIYGDGPQRLEIEQFIFLNSDLGIFYHGAVKQSDLHEKLVEYSYALVALNNPIYGAVPSKIYESMYCGLPILYIGDGEAAVLIEENQCGWHVEPMNWIHIKDRITVVSNLDYEVINSLKAHARSVAINKFNRQSNTKNLVDQILKIK